MIQTIGAIVIVIALAGFVNFVQGLARFLRQVDDVQNDESWYD